MKGSTTYIFAATISSLLWAPIVPAQQAPASNEIKIDWTQTVTVDLSTSTTSR